MAWLVAMAQEKEVLHRHSNEICRSLADRPATCTMLANEMYSRQLIPEDIRDEVLDKSGKEATSALMCALEATVSVTPQSLMKIITVLEGLTRTEPAASKMKKALSKSFSIRRTSMSSTSNPAKGNVPMEIDPQIDVIYRIHYLQTKYTELILTLGEALHDGPVQKIRNIVIAALTPGTQATRACIDQLQMITRVDDILALVRQFNLCSYLNYRILVAISESHENSLIRNAVQSYQTEFTAFSKAVSISLVVSIVAKYSQPNGLPSIVVRLNEAWGSRSLYTLRETLTRQLGRWEDLQFESAQEGSLVLTFNTLPCSLSSVSTALASMEVSKALQELEITVLSVDSEPVDKPGLFEEEDEGKTMEVSTGLTREVPFVEPPSRDYFCPLCDKLLLEPYQMKCCGDHVCQQCNSRLCGNVNASCPSCESLDVHALMDKYFKRQVLSSKVHCYHREAGCEWEGELRELERHLNAKDCWCDYVFVACAFCCGQEVRRRELKAHKTEHCPKRPATCEYCSYHNTYDVVTEKHSLVCDEFPVECPNQCGVNVSTVTLLQIDNTPIPEHEAQEIQSFKMKRKELQSHLKDACPLEKVDCEFSSAGCQVKLLRKEMQSHLQDAMLEHNILLKGALDSSLKKIAHLSRIVELGGGTVSKQPAISSPSLDQYRSNLPPVVFTITDITTMKKESQAWFSPPFYSFPGGHKLQLKVYPNGWSVGENTHLSVSTYVMRGENDDDLQWPLSADIEVELLKFGSDKGHHSQMVYLPGDEFCCRVTDGVQSVRGHGIELFASHSFIFHPSSEYVMDGCLRIRVKEVSTHAIPNASKVPSWQDSSLPSQSLCEFTLPGFSRCKAANLCFHSPPFYSCPQGYKMLLRVHASGKRSGLGSYISIGAQLMKGEFDDSLSWPFNHDVAYELVNWREDRNHHHGAISFGQVDEKACSKVVVDIARSGYLDDKFIPHSALPYDSSTNTQYLQGDCLRFRVKEVVVYSTPSIPKIPTWQDPTLPSHSLFEFTLSEFSKRKQFNNVYYTTPFYTRQGGYKMQVEVCANGFRQSPGAGSHVSVYVSILKGEHDDSLQWPLTMDVVVQLLNYRRNYNHVKRVVHFQHVAKLDLASTEIVGFCSGYARFVAHAFLVSNHFQDVEYLQDDCLRFSVDITGPTM